MKKRNWLLTIAFAVLSLTVISTCVIGSTYAKYTSKITGSGSAEAAGFLITAGQTTATEENVLMAPEVAAEYSLTINYFSQVVTKLEAAGGASTTTGTGIFDPTTWQALVTWYNTNHEEIATATGATGAAVDGDLAVSDIIQVTIGSGSATDDIAKQLAAAIAAASSNKVSIDGSDSTGKTLTAMAADETTAISAAIKINVEWVSDATGDDLFDTFIGNCIAAFATNTALTYGELTAIGTNGSSDGAVQLPASATDSTVGIALNITATQVVAGA